MKKLSNIKTLGLFLTLAFLLSLSFSLIPMTAFAVVLDVTNAQKLSLATSTPIGQKVRVTDRFVVSGIPIQYDEANDFYIYLGDENGKHSYGAFHNPTGAKIEWLNSHGSTFWSIFGQLYTSDEDVEEPWMVTSWSSNQESDPVFTHPAVQELKAASTTQGGVFVAGGTQDGVYTTVAGYNADDYAILGSNPDDGPSIIHNGIFIRGEDEIETRWLFKDNSSNAVYYNLSDVATPDLATEAMRYAGETFTERGTHNGRPYYNRSISPDNLTDRALVFNGLRWQYWRNDVVDDQADEGLEATPDLASGWGTPITRGVWLNASDDSPASISVTSITQGELDAGVTVAGAGTSADNQILLPSPLPIPGFISGRVQYSLNGEDHTAGGVPALGWNEGYWKKYLDVNADTQYSAQSELPFPWGAIFEVGQFDVGDPPPPEVYRNDIASEANWILSSLPTPTSLAFSVQPGNATAGAVISPAVSVSVLDASSTLISDATTTVTLSLGANPGSSTLSGTLSKTATSGVATFNDLSLNNASTGYTLVASSSGLTGTTSSSFNISAIPSSGGGGGGSGGGGASTGSTSASPPNPSATSTFTSSDCLQGDLFSHSSGLRCPAPPRGCTLTSLYSPTTGERCPSNSSGQAPSTSRGQATLPNISLFNRDLTLKDTGEDVRALQIFLNREGFILINTGPGSKGSESTYFGELTKTALGKFQKAKGIKPSAGYFGGITRAYLKSHY